jgi:DNA polymerase-1
MKLAVDGDIYAYQYSASNEEYVEFDGWLLPKWDLREMKAQWKHFLSEKLPRHKEFVVCFSDSVNFRKTVDPTYKQNRSGHAKPVMYRPLVEWIKETYPCLVYPTLEADDVIGILVTRDNFVSVSEDKDMKTLRGAHFNTKDKALFSVTQDEADRFWMTQTLTGDTVDGYTGIPGIGPKKAEGILSGATTLSELWTRVVEAYVANGLTEDDAIRQARLSRILRDGDYDLQHKEVRLWKP